MKRPTSALHSFVTLCGLLVGLLFAHADCVTPPAGLVGWWKGDGTTLDSIAANSGVNQNAGYTNGVVGQAFAFDPENLPYGTYSGIQIADQPAYALTNSMTIEGWIRPRGDGYIIFFRGDHRPGTDPYFLSMQANNKINFYIGDAVGNSATVAATLPYFAWTHVAATLDGGTGAMSIYTNGVLAETLNTTVRPFGELLADQSPGVGIGNLNDGGNNFPFLGDVDEIGLYNRALSVGEIQAIYNAGSAGKCVPVVQTNNCVTPPNGLVSWWPGEGNANDVIGTNNGILSGGIASDSGEVGQAFVFDGSGSSIKVPASPSLNVGLGAGFTIETWVNPASYDQGPLMEWNNGAGGIGVHLWLSTDVTPGTGFRNLFANLVDTTGTVHSFGSAAGIMNSNMFQHVALTYNKATGVAVLYRNGAVVASQTLGSFTPETSYDFYIGYRPYPVYFTGKIDEPTLYERDLSASEIQAIYNAGSAGKCAPVVQTNICVPAPAGLVAWWLGENNANEIIGGTAGTVYSGTSYASGEVGQAFAFDGVAGCVMNPDMPTMTSIQNSFTMEFWAYPQKGFDIAGEADGGYTGISGQSYAIFPDWGGLDGPAGVGVSVGTNGISVIEHAHDYMPSVLSYTNSITGWTHIAVVYENKQPTLYVNGVNVRTGITSSRSFVYPSKDLGNSYGSVFGHQFNTYGPYAGLLDEIAIYNRALTSSEIQSVYNAGSAGKCTPVAIPPVAPAISSFTLSAATNGAAVTISGNNFSPTAAANIVYFGAVRAIVLSASPTSLTVTVPAGATFAPITVTTEGLTTYSPRPFLPTFAGDGSSISASSFGSRQNLESGNGPIQVVIADLDNDGKPDLIVANDYNNTISLYRNISTDHVLTAASFAPPVDLPTPTGSYSPYGIVAADVDGDGKLDIIATDYIDQNVISVYRNACTPGEISAGAFANRVDFPTGSQPQGVDVRDIDGDGRPDILVANTGDGTVSILRNTSVMGSLTTNSFAPKIDFATGGGCANVTVGDLDGDGLPDVVTANAGSSTVTLLRNISSPGGFTFDPKVDFATTEGPIHVKLVDLDGDGKLDVTVASYISQTFSVFRNTSTVGSLNTDSLAARTDYSLGGRGHTTAVGDLDGDSKPDLAVATELDSLISIFQNSSTPGSFTNSSLTGPANLATGWNAWGVTVGDLDADGRPDVVFANSYDHNISIYQNLSPFAGPPVPVTCVTPPAGIVGWWPAEGNASDAFSGITDTLQGDVRYSLGEVGQAFSFNDDNAAVVIPASPNLDVGSSDGLTLEAWINPTDVTQAHPLFEWNNSVYWGVHFYIAPGQPTSGSSGPAGPGQLYANVVDQYGSWHQMGSPAGVVVPGTFQHVALTYDKASGVATIYRNGEIVSQINLGSFNPLTSYDLFLGRRQAPSGEVCSFAGLMDEPAVYNRALSSAEIQATYHAGSAGKCALPLNHPPVADATATTSPIISLNTSNATAALDGSLSSDLDGDPLQYQWTKNNASIASGIVAVVVLPVGSNSITLSVSDGRATSWQTIPVEVITTGQAVQRLMNLVNADVAKAKSLAAKLSAAIKAIDRSKPAAAIDRLHAFQKQVRTQVARLNPALAETLINDAQDIIDALASGGTANHGKVDASLHQADGHLHLKFTAPRRQAYIIEASSDLRDWKKIGVAKDQGDGTFDFNDVEASKMSARYYRIVIP